MVIIINMLACIIDPSHKFVHRLLDRSRNNTLVCPRVFLFFRVFLAADTRPYVLIAICGTYNLIIAGCLTGHDQI